MNIITTVGTYLPSVILAGLVATIILTVLRQSLGKRSDLIPSSIPDRIMQLASAVSLSITIIAMVGYIAIQTFSESTPSALESRGDIGNRRISLTQKERTVREVLFSIAEQVEAGTALSKDLKGLDDTILLEVNQSKLSDVLNDLCSAKGWSCTIQKEPRPVILVIPAEKPSS